MRKSLIFLIILVVALLFAAAVFSHDDEAENLEVKTNGFFEDFLPLPFMIGIFIISAIPFLILAYKWKKISKQHIIFWIIIYLVGSITLVIIGDAINLTVKSETKGPVHWHADYEIWSCGKQLDLKDPEGMANRVGTRLFHEHGDKRMHAEGIIEDIRDVDLHNFFNFIDGFLSENSFSVPTNDGLFSVKDGEFCNGEAGEIGRA